MYSKIIIFFYIKEISHSGAERSPNNDEHHNSQMLVRSFHKNIDNKDRYNSTYTDDTTYLEQEHAMHRVSSMEPALLFDTRNPTSFSNSIRYSGGPSTSSTLQNRALTPLTDAPLPSPPVGKSFSYSNKDVFVMTTQLQPPPVEKSLTPRVSSSILTSTPDPNDSNSDKSDKSPYWRDK